MKKWLTELKLKKMWILLFLMSLPILTAIVYMIEMYYTDYSHVSLGEFQMLTVHGWVWPSIPLFITHVETVIFVVASVWFLVLCKRKFS